jgi:MFS family permease
MGIIALPIVLLLLFLIPSQRASVAPRAGRAGLARAGRAIVAVFGNPQSIVCGLIAGLVFIPTTIFDMVWGIRFLEEAHDMPYSLAVLRSASVPFGWIIGCPLLGWLSDRIGRRKPVIVGAGLVLFLCLTLILYGPVGVFPPFSLGLVAGIASGAAMIPYTVIKEVNRPEHSGTATGVINFINFALTALLGPIFARLLVRVSEGGERELAHYQTTFSPLLVGVGIAIALTFALRESGPAARASAAATAT